MSMAVILVMGPVLFSILLGGCIWNLNEIGPVLSEEKPFENVNRQLICDLWPMSPNDLDL